MLLMMMIDLKYYYTFGIFGISTTKQNFKRYFKNYKNSKLNVHLLSYSKASGLNDSGPI